jgi:hypothetical protein
MISIDLVVGTGPIQLRAHWTRPGQLAARSLARDIYAVRPAKMTQRDSRPEAHATMEA